MSKLDEDEIETIAGCGLILAFIPMAAVNVAIEAVVAKMIWLWFIVPEFSAEPLTWPAVVGIGLLASHWTHQHAYRKNAKAIETFATWISGCVLHPLLLLFVAWVASVILY